MSDSGDEEDDEFPSPGSSGVSLPSGLKNAGKAGVVAGAGLLIAILVVVLLFTLFAVPITGVLWAFGEVSIELVVAVLVVWATVNTIAEVFSGE